MIKDLRKKTSDELKLMVVQLRSQLMESRFKAAQGELDKTHLLKEMRRLIAQVLTVLHERKEPMQTSDWHKFNKMVAEEQSKKTEIEASNKASEKDSFLSKLKGKASSFIKGDSAKEEGKDS